MILEYFPPFSDPSNVVRALEKSSITRFVDFTFRAQYYFPLSFPFASSEENDVENEYQVKV